MGITFLNKMDKNNNKGNNQNYNQGPPQGYNQNYNQGPPQGYNQRYNQGPPQGYNHSGPMPNNNNQNQNQGRQMDTLGFPQGPHGGGSSFLRLPDPNAMQGHDQ